MVTDDNTEMVVRVFPSPGETLPLRNLYLNHDVAVQQDNKKGHQKPFVYANYVVSMDGRISVTHPQTGEKSIPDALTNDSDWRLYQELAAQADVLVTSGRYVRHMVDKKIQDGLPVSLAEKFSDLRDWRILQGLAPQPAVAVVTHNLDLPWDNIRATLKRPVIAITIADCANGGDSHPKIPGIEIIQTTGNEGVDGEQFVNALASMGLYNIYVIAGPKVLGTLIAGSVLDRLYLTQVHKLIGGKVYDTFLETEYLKQPVNLKLRCLYQNMHSLRNFEQSFAVFDVLK